MPASPDVVWARVSTFEGINAELQPLMRMTAPGSVRALEPGRGFLERSRMLSMRVWEHERRLQPVAGGCRIVDRLTFQPRLPGMGPLLERFIRLTFRHRHRRLRGQFG